MTEYINIKAKEVILQNIEAFSQNLNFNVKVEKILKGSLDLIPSIWPSVKIQIMGRKVCLRYKGKTLQGIVNKLLKKKLVDIVQQLFALLH